MDFPVYLKNGEQVKVNGIFLLLYDVKVRKDGLPIF